MDFFFKPQGIAVKGEDGSLAGHGASCPAIDENEKGVRLGVCPRLRTDYTAESI